MTARLVSASPGRRSRLFRCSRLRGLALALALAGKGLVAAPAAASAEVPKLGKVALVDMQRVLDETVEGKRARKELEASSKRKIEKLEKKRAKLEADQGRLRSLTGEALAQAQAKLEQDYYELQAMYGTLQQELSQQEAKLLETIYVNCQAVVGELAKEAQLDLVLVRDDNTVIYAKDAFDVTSEIIKRYDKRFK